MVFIGKPLSSKLQRIPMVLFLLSMLFGLIMMLFLNFKYSTVFLELNIIKISNTVLGFGFIFDYLGISFSFVVNIISACVFLFSVNYMKEDKFSFRFVLILSLFVFSMNLLVCSGSFLMLMLGWDGLGVSSFALIIYYQNYNSLMSGLMTLMTNRIGDVILMWLVIYFCILGEFNIHVNTFLGIGFIFFILAAMTKSAQYPFSSWLPAAMAAPTPVSALVHSSTLVTAGVFLLIRMDLNVLNFWGLSLLSFVSSLTAVLGGMSACYENDLKKIIAFSTLSQLGLMMFSVSLKFYNLSLIHLYTHAMFKSMLFLCAGLMMMSMFGNQDIRMMGNTLIFNPMVVLFMNLSSFCLMGFPFLSSYYSKHLIYDMMFMNSLNFFSMFMFLLATLLTGFYSGRMMMKLFMISAGSKSCLKLTLDFFVPLFLLFFFSVIGGQLFYYLELGFLFTSFLPLWWNLTVSLLPLIGVIISFNHVLKPKYLGMSMWFLSPLTKFTPMLMFNSMKDLKSLDYGWLEPSINHGINIFGQKLNLKFNSLTFNMTSLWGGCLAVLVTCLLLL